MLRFNKRASIAFLSLTGTLNCIGKVSYCTSCISLNHV